MNIRIIISVFVAVGHCRVWSRVTDDKVGNDDFAKWFNKVMAVEDVLGPSMFSYY